jgi:hypothetical protein
MKEFTIKQFKTTSILLVFLWLSSIVTSTFGSITSNISGAHKVNALPTLALTSGTHNPTVCSGTSISATYTFGGSATDVTAINLPLGLQQSINNNKLTIYGTPIANGTYTVSTINSSSCANSSLNGTIEILPSNPLMTTVIGTVFPFVCWNTNEFDSLFPITVNLKSVPNPQSENPLADLSNETPLYSTKAIYYDGSVFVPDSPKSPGTIGALNNYGLPINWMDAICVQGSASTTDILKENEIPVTINGSTLGLYKIENVIKDDYILEIKREGFVTRWAKIKVNADAEVEYFGHRELVAGDVDNDFLIKLTDISKEKLQIGSNYAIPSTHYISKYDLNADGNVDQLDFNLILKFTGFWFYHYQETKEWLDALKIQY